MKQLGLCAGYLFNEVGITNPRCGMQMKTILDSAHCPLACHGPPFEVVNSAAKGHLLCVLREANAP